MLGPSDSAITLSQMNREIYCKSYVCSLFKNIASNCHDFFTDHFFIFAFLMTDTIYEAVIINN